jgi:hypothetical protein
MLMKTRRVAPGGNARHGHFFFAAVAAMLVCGQLSSAAAQNRLPVKLEIVPSAHAVDVGAGVTLDVILRAADNGTAAAPKDLSIQLELKAPSGPVALPNIVIAAGQSAGQVQFQVTAPGMWAVRARNSELLEGGTVIYAKPAGLHSALTGSGSQAAQAEAMPPAPAPPLEVALNNGGQATTQTRGIDDVMREQNGGGNGGSAELAVAAPTASGAATVVLATSPDRRVLADRQDAATIYAFLRTGAAGEDIRIQLVASLGTISPNPLVIRKGEFSGQATLVADRVGQARIRYVAEQPQVAIEASADMHIDFAPAITQLQLRASPPEVSLLDAPQIVVELQDAAGHVVATDEPRRISLYLEKGNGEIAPVEVEVAKDEATGRANFTPWWMGTTTVAAATPAILTKSTTLRVVLPTLLIALTAVGGLIGGVMAFWTKRTRWWRIVIGLFTGFVLYWAMIFGLLQSIPRAAALNPLSAFAVAIIGGYIGPQLLGVLAQKFGVGPTSPGPAVRSTHRQPKTNRDSHAKNPG